SFAAQNSDYLLHLATGRLIAQGAYQVGVDPFTYTTTGVTWINHNWLYDWFQYLLYSLAGGTGLVIAKAILVVALVIVLLRIRRPGGERLLPIVCVTLALLA